MWKCENCETINDGEFCVICGERKTERVSAEQSSRASDARYISPEPVRRMVSPETVTPKNNKSVIIVLVIVVVCLLAVVAGLAAFFMNDRNKTARNQNENYEQNTETEVQLAFGETDLVAYPSYVSKVNSEYSYRYEIPEHFEKYKNYNYELGYCAPDNTAIISFESAYNTEEWTPQERIEQFINETGGRVTYKDNGDDWYAVSMENDGVAYYVKGFTDHYIREFRITFPREYIDIYGDYVEYMEDNFERTDKEE